MLGERLTLKENRDEKDKFYFDCFFLRIIQMENIMEDPRCCGSGTCIINAEGFCWCGQRWNGTRMCFPEVSGGTANGDHAAEASSAAQLKDGSASA